MYSIVKGLIAKHSPYDKALGIKAVAFSSNGQYLSVGSYDQSVTLILSIGTNI